MIEPFDPRARTGFRCPDCGKVSLSITKAIELHPDARWTEITLQVLSCERCGFVGIGVYEENNWGSSEIVHHNGYRTTELLGAQLSDLIDACPRRSDRRCDCTSCATLSVTNEEGEWSWLEQRGAGERFALRLEPVGADEPAPSIDTDYDHFFEDRAPPNPTKRQDSVGSMTLPIYPARKRWTPRWVFFWTLVAFLTIGGAGAWHRDVTREAGLWLELREQWNWPAALATFGSLAAYVGMALMVSWFIAMNVSWLLNEARAGYRRLRRRTRK